MSPPNNKKRLFLIDSAALAYRSFFAFVRNPLINSKGINTSGVFGFATTLMRILKDEDPDYIACIFDTREPTFRHDAYAEYKATREKMPEELGDQFPVIQEMVAAFRIPCIEKVGYEADDIIATYARAAEKEGLCTYIVSGDKDLMQLLSDSTLMYSLKVNAGKPEIAGPEGVVERLGVPPERVVDLLALMGDSSDNVPGVKGIGPKTAIPLLETFGSVESILENLDKIERESTRTKMEAGRESAILSKELVTLKDDIKLELDIHDLKRDTPDNEKLVALFRDLEFNRMVAELSGLSGMATVQTKREYQTIQSEETLQDLINTLKKSKLIAVDLETTSLEPMRAEIVGLSFSWAKGEAAYVPIRTKAEDRALDLFKPEKQHPFLTELKPLLEDPDIQKCGQNIKYDMMVLERAGIHMQGVVFDTMVAAYLLNPSARQFNLDTLALEYLNMKKIPTSDIIGKGAKQITMDMADLEKVSEYASEDADATFQLREVFEPQLKRYNLMSLFEEIEIPLVRVLMDMEMAGVALDVDLLNQMSGEMDGQLQDIRENIYKLAGEEFNINSTQQLGAILFEKLKVHEILGWRRPKRTKTGYSTDQQTLESLAAHPLPKTLLDYRQLTKLKSTYVDALPKLIHPETHKVHTSFNQTVAATGRLSSNNPNLQNIPIRTELGREIRKAFISSFPDGQILSADYSQIELRLMAHISGDETLIESFKQGEDVHRRTAAEIFDLKPEEVSDDHRRQAKTINFGIMYGMGQYGLARRLGISVEEAGQFISAYLARYAKVNDYMANTIAKAYEQGYVTTLLNRRRYLPELKSDNRNIRDFGERTAINTPIQGTAADLIKIAMIKIADRLRSESWQSKMVLQIHDELVFDVVPGEVDRLTEMVRTEMEGAIELSVPVKVDVGAGANWYMAH